MGGVGEMGDKGERGPIGMKGAMGDEGWQLFLSLYTYIHIVWIYIEASSFIQGQRVVRVTWEKREQLVLKDRRGRLVKKKVTKENVDLKVY